MYQQNYEALSANAEKMRRLKKIFTVTFVISAVPPLLYTVLGLLSIVSLIMTAGKVAPSAGFVFTAVFSVVALVCCSFSFMMEKKAIIVSIPLLIFLAIVYAFSGNMLFFILSIVGSAMHIWCFKQYPQIDYLKSQEGYPDFNTIASSHHTSRRFSDEELKNRTGSSEKNIADFAMEEIKLPSETNENII